MKIFNDKPNLPAYKVMNRINPKKLLNSQWTAVQPVNKERHFIVSELKIDDSGVVECCSLEAIISKRTTNIDWRELKSSENWLLGWK